MPTPPIGADVRLRRLAAVLLLAALGLVACGDGNGDRQAATTTTGVQETTQPTRQDPPEHWVGIDDSGRLVVVGSEDGEVERVLGEFDHPEECPASGEPGAGCEWVTEVALSPDSQDVYYETCCEPAPGTIYRVPIAGGDPDMITNGGFPAVDPDGERLATVELQWVAIHHLESERDPELFESSEMPGTLHGMTWSPDGERVAFTRFERTDRPGTLQILDIAEDDSLDDARAVDGSADEGSWTLPTFRSDGMVAVAEQELELPDGPTGSARILLIDPDSGEVANDFDPGGSVLSQHYDSAGENLIYVTDDGAVSWRDFDGEDSELTPDGYLAAAW